MWRGRLGWCNYNCLDSVVVVICAIVRGAVVVCGGLVVPVGVDGLDVFRGVTLGG